MKGIARIAFVLCGLFLLGGTEAVFAQTEGPAATVWKGEKNPKEPPKSPDPGPKPWPKPPPGPTWSIGQSARKKDLEDYRVHLETFRIQLEDAREANGGRASTEYRDLLNEYKMGLDKYQEEKQKLLFDVGSPVGKEPDSSRDGGG